MTRTLLVVPTGHGVGLTATCLGLVRALDRAGVDVGFYKPIAQYRPGPAAPERSTALVRLTTHLTPPEPLAAGDARHLLSADGLDELMETVIARGATVLDRRDVVVVEGLVPSREHVYATRVNQALARALDADVLLVGSLPASDAEPNDPQALADAIAIAADTYRSGEQARVVGCVVNRVPTGAGAEILSQLRKALATESLRLVGAVPFAPELAWPRVADLVPALAARVLNAGDLGRRVSDVVVCAQAVPGLLPLLRDGRLVVVPGDRHEVVMGACLAALNGTRLAALLLTVGIEPHPDVWQLTKAACDTGLPILLVDDYTYPTAMAVSQLDPEIPVDDRERAELTMTTVADALDGDWLASVPSGAHSPRLTPAAFRHRLTTWALAAHKRIVLPEGSEPRTLQAAAVCHERGIAECVLLAAPDEVTKVAREIGLSLPAALQITDPASLVDRYLPRLVELRGHKGVTPEIAREQLADPVLVGTLMLEAGEVDGLVSGAVHTTADTVRPALQILRTRPGASLVSSVFFMCLPDEVVVYADCAINPDPTAEQLADIAVQSADSARAFGIDPRVAMISFSTGTSGSGSDVEKVAAATRIARERAPHLAIDGPLQYDAAAVASVGRSKRPGSPVAGRANVFIFPDLNTGNTTYKAVQRSADAVSIGPMLQGLAKPVNDLSRGALVEDIVYTIALTAIQAAAQGSGLTPGQG